MRAATLRGISLTTALILGVTLFFAGWATWPPRGEERRWLLLALLALWGALVTVGWQRGVQPGFAPWLLVLALVGALVALLVVWSLTNVVGKPRSREEPDGSGRS